MQELPLGRFQRRLEATAHVFEDSLIFRLAFAFATVDQTLLETPLLIFGSFETAMVVCNAAVHCIREALGHFLILRIRKRN
jgi:hypothetical protein